MNTTKSWIISLWHSFLAGFLIAIVPVLNNLDIHNIDKAALYGLLFAGVRGGIKALGQLLASKA